MMNIMETPKREDQAEDAVKWIDELLTTDLPQGCSQLKSLDGYCCLGIGANLLVSDEEWADDDGTSVVLQVMTGLYSENGTVRPGHKNIAASGLVDMNDSFGKQFKDIGIAMKAHPEYYFNDGVHELIAKHYK